MYKKLLSFALLSSLIISAVGTAGAEVVTDDWQTVALWHMEQTTTATDRCSNTRDAIADDDSVSQSGRARNLILGRRLGSCTNILDPATLPTLTSGLFGNALDFNGSQAAFTNGGWQNQDDVIVEMYFYPRSFAADLTLLAVTNSFELRQRTGGFVTAFVWDGGSVASANSPTFSLNEWHRLVATVTDGQIVVSIDDVAGTAGSYTQINDCHHPNIYIGNAYDFNRKYDGMIDEIKISNPTVEIPAFTEPYEDDYNTFLLYHFDEILETSPRRTPDDDSLTPGRGLDPARNLDGILMPESTAGETYTGPALVTSFGGDPNEGFGRCLEFDGYRYVKVQGVDQSDEFGIPNDNFRIELWAKHDAQKLDDGYEYYFFHQPSRFRFSLRDLAGGTWGVRFVTWGNVDPYLKVLDVTISDPTVWNHYAFEFYQGEMRTFINGNLADQTTAAYTETAAAIRQLFIGCSNVTDHMIIGKIDEFRISRAVPKDPECGDWGYSIADLNQDCYVGIDDLKILVSQWLLDCSQPGNPDCEY